MKRSRSPSELDLERRDEKRIRLSPRPRKRTPSPRRKSGRSPSPRKRTPSPRRRKRSPSPLVISPKKRKTEKEKKRSLSPVRVKKERSSRSPRNERQDKRVKPERSPKRVKQERSQSPKQKKERSPRRVKQESRGRSRSPQKNKRSNSPRKGNKYKSNGRPRQDDGGRPRQAQDEGKMEWGKKNKESSEEESIEKEKPNFKPSGLLNPKQVVRGVEVKYIEAPDAGTPSLKWRLYPFKGEKALEPIKIFAKSHYLLGRLRKVVDIPLDHPSCSSQHCVVQFRVIDIRDDETNTMVKLNKPYIMDLESTNGTFLNGTRVDPMRYIELLERDVLKFGNSSREFVLLHEGTT